MDLYDAYADDYFSRCEDMTPPDGYLIDDNDDERETKQMSIMRRNVAIPMKNIDEVFKEIEKQAEQKTDEQKKNEGVEENGKLICIR